VDQEIKIQYNRLGGPRENIHRRIGTYNGCMYGYIAVSI
jgi:hypothetical protein